MTIPRFIIRSFIRPSVAKPNLARRYRTTTETTMTVGLGLPRANCEHRAADFINVREDIADLFAYYGPNQS